MMILAGRGDNTIGIYRFNRSSDSILELIQTNNFLNTTQKAFSIMPKHVVDVSKQEIMRSVRATNTGKLEVLAMSIPTKVGGFNQEYYPAFDANEPSNTAEAWCNGQDVPAKTMQLTSIKKKKQGGNRPNKQSADGASAAKTSAAEESKETAAMN